MFLLPAFVFCTFQQEMFILWHLHQYLHEPWTRISNPSIRTFCFYSLTFFCLQCLKPDWATEWVLRLAELLINRGATQYHCWRVYKLVFIFSSISLSSTVDLSPCSVNEWGTSDTDWPSLFIMIPVSFLTHYFHLKDWSVKNNPHLSLAGRCLTTEVWSQDPRTLWSQLHPWKTQ